MVLSAGSCSVATVGEDAAPSSVAFDSRSTTSATIPTIPTTTVPESAGSSEEPTSLTSASSTTTIPCDAPATAIAYAVSGVPDKLNIRSGAGTSNSIEGAFAADARDIFFTADCELVGTLAWWKLASGDGWVASSYVTPQGNSICGGGGFSGQSVSDLTAVEAEIDGDGRLDTVYSFVRDGQLHVAAELGDGGYIETTYAEDDTGEFFFGYPVDLFNIRAIRPAGRSADVLLADSSNNQFYMFSYRLCELPLLGGLETDGPFSFVYLNTPELSQRLVCTIESNGTNLYMHRFGTDIGGEELQHVRFDDTYHGAGTEGPIEVDPNGVYWAC